MTAFDCPRCAVTLTMTERHGIEIDYCPQCRGVWLDRGELDKIIERVSAGGMPIAAAPQATGWTQPAVAGWSAPPQAAPQGYPAPPPRSHGRYDDDDDHRRGYRKPRKHWLSELFD